MISRGGKYLDLFNIIFGLLLIYTADREVLCLRLLYFSYGSIASFTVVVQLSLMLFYIQTLRFFVISYATYLFGSCVRVIFSVGVDSHEASWFVRLRLPTAWSILKIVFSGMFRFNLRSSTTRNCS